MHQSRKILLHLVFIIGMFFLLACAQERQENSTNTSIAAEETILAKRKHRQHRQRRNRDSDIQESSSTQTISSSLKPLQISPQATDPMINDWLEPHYVYVDQSVPSVHKLLVFFPGSYGDPSRQQLIVEEAAQLGYQAINLSYPNSWTVGGLCRNSGDTDCYEKVRQEIIDGNNHSEEVDIDRANSIENRLVKLLHYLDKEQPSEGWSNYLSGEKPRWESIIVAGHSQGGGQAAMIAKNNLVARVVMLSAPLDFNKESQMTASWLSSSHVTPTERYYGFAHVEDKGFEQIQESWRLLGMAKYGDIVKVENESSPYGNSHQLVTDLTPARRNKYHGSVATDETTPKSADGTPVFEPVWQYLFELDESEQK
jgi:hypothetical protein